MQLSGTESDERGAFHRIVTPQLGKCGTCGAETSMFINRNGSTKCVECDQRDTILARSETA